MICSITLCECMYVKYSEREADREKRDTPPARLCVSEPKYLALCVGVREG